MTHRWLNGFRMYDSLELLCVGVCILILVIGLIFTAIVT